MKKLISIYKNAPTVGKVIMIIAALVILYVAYNVLLKVYTKLTAPKSSVDAAKDELKDLNQAGTGPHYSEVQFKTWADTLEQAMSGQGTDEDQVKRIFEYMQNRADVLQLIKSFGTRDYADDKFLLWNVKPFNLNQWIGAEFDGPDTDFYINDVLKKRGIDYKF